MANVQAAAGPKLMRGGYPPELNLGLQNMTALRVVFLNDFFGKHIVPQEDSPKGKKDDKRDQFASISREGDF